MMLAIAIVLLPLIISLPFAGKRRRSLALFALLVAGFGAGALVVRQESRPPLVNLAVLALLLGLFRLAGACEAKAPER